MKSHKVKTKKLPVHALSAITFVTGITALVLAIVVVKIGIPQFSQAASPKKTLPPIICLTIDFRCPIDSTIAARLKGQNLTNAVLVGVSYVDNSGLIDLSNTTFINAVMGLPTSHSRISTEVDFSNDDFTGAIFTNMLTNAQVNFTNDNFTNANFATSFWNGFANVTGVTWSNTTCPDGTNSDNDGNTCVGHGF